MAVTEAVEHSVWCPTEPAVGRVSVVALEEESICQHCGVLEQFNRFLECFGRGLFYSTLHEGDWDGAVGRCVLYFASAWPLSSLESLFFMQELYSWFFVATEKGIFWSLLYERSWPVLLSSGALLGVMYCSGMNICIGSPSVYVGQYINSTFPTILSDVPQCLWSVDIPTLTYLGQ